MELKIYLAADNIISSMGFTTRENVDAIHSYRSGIRRDESKEIADAPILAGRIDNTRLAKIAAEQQLQSFSRLEQLIILSVQDVLHQKQIDIKGKDCAVVLATTKGNVEYLENNTEKINERAFLWSTAEKIEEYFGLANKITTISNACISGISAFVAAQRMIELEGYRNVLVIGADVLSHFVTSGFRSFKSVSENPCCPYDAARDGLNLGEACGTVLLTTDPTPDAILLSGGAISDDANHISGPSRTGDGLYLAIRNAMQEAGLTAKDINAVNLHGTATVFNDEMESKAVNLAELQEVPANSFKSYFGHTLAASGVVETIISAIQLKENTVFGTLNYKECGVPMPLNVSGEHRKVTLNNLVKTGSGFGGCNAAIILSKTKGKPLHAEKATTYSEIRNCLIENSTIRVDGKEIFVSEQTDFGLFIREAFKNLGETNMKFYKMDDLAKLGYIAAEYLLKDISFEPEEMAIILANSAGSLDTDSKHQALIDNGGDDAASPAIFVYTLPNVAIGEICIKHKIKGENTFFITRDFQSDALKQQALTTMRKTGVKYCIYGWCEFLQNKYKADFRLMQADRPC